MKQIKKYQTSNASSKEQPTEEYSLLKISISFKLTKEGTKIFSFTSFKIDRLPIYFSSSVWIWSTLPSGWFTFGNYWTFNTSFSHLFAFLGYKSSSNSFTIPIKLSYLFIIFWWWLLHWPGSLDPTIFDIFWWTPFSLRLVVESIKTLWCSTKKLRYFFCSTELQWYVFVDLLFFPFF